MKKDNNIFFKYGLDIEDISNLLQGDCGLGSMKRAVRFVKQYRNPLYTDGLKSLKRALTEDYDGVALEYTLAPWKRRAKEYKNMAKEAFEYVMLELGLTQEEINVLLQNN